MQSVETVGEPKSFGAHKAYPYEKAVEEYGSNIGLKRAGTYKALNRLIQGSAADQIKKAMVELYKEGIIPMIQIHDELTISMENEDKKDKIIEIMENCLEMEIPSKVDLAITRSGSSMISELTNANIPFVSVPLPSSADNHQLKNALFYKKKKFAFLIEEKDLKVKLPILLKEIFKNYSILT